MPRYVAHRGGAARWPENSLTAFRGAIAGGAQLLELDVHLTADGAVAVMHDPTLDRTSTGTGPLARCTRADLRAARLRDARGAVTDDWVPTLEEVLELAKPAGVGFLIEIKTPGPAVTFERRGQRIERVAGARYEGLERKVIDAVVGAGFAER
ncbi:MAG TPA: glycerophosphodiester phosphodiesterase family protein, partial [Terriglobales bacterium]|nr:glycerophosphodiester phosphodiesterase family protein [Terriglobales bacterium]